MEMRRCAAASKKTVCTKYEAERRYYSIERGTLLEWWSSIVIDKRGLYARPKRHGYLRHEYATTNDRRAWDGSLAIITHGKVVCSNE
jgi:hypothetical protein